MDSDIYIHKRVSEVDGGFAKPHHGDAFCIRRLGFFTSFSSRVRGGPFVFAVEDLAAPHAAGGGGYVRGSLVWPPSLGPIRN